MIICDYCTYNCNQPNTFKKHIKFHHSTVFNTEYDLEKYYSLKAFSLDEKLIQSIITDYNNGVSIPDLVIKYACKNIKKLLQFNNVSFRTLKETLKTDYYKNKIKNTNLKKYGCENPSSNEEIKQKRKETFLKNHGYENNFCNSDIQKLAESRIDRELSGIKIKNAVLKKYGVENVMQVDSIVRKAKLSIRKYYDSLTSDERRVLTEKASRHITYTSKTQLRIQFILNELNIEYTPNAFLWSYNYDFKFKNKILLEVQGDFWHANPKIYKENDLMLGDVQAKDFWEKDERKKLIAIKNGYILICLWEADIKKMTDLDLKTFIFKNILEK